MVSCQYNRKLYKKGRDEIIINSNNQMRWNPKKLIKTIKKIYRYNEIK